MKWILCCSLLILFLNGCWQNRYVSYDGIVSRHSSTWNESECRTIIESHTEYNRHDHDSPVTVIATEYTPQVFMAINREEQRRKELSDSKYVANLNESMKRFLGLSVHSANDTVYDANGYLYKNEAQLDSLIFLVSISDKNDFVNVAGPGSLATPALNQIFDLKNFKFYDPDLLDLKDKIFLQNAQGMLLKPNWVAAERNGRLIRNESFIVMFQLRQPGGHFFEFSSKMALVFRGFEHDIRLGFQIISTESE